jgi:hypothetical protein
MERRRFLPVGVCLWGLAAPLSAGSPTRAQTVRLPAAGFDLVGLRPLTVQVMTMEVNDLLAVAGARLEWRWPRPGAQTAPDELTVVFLASPSRGSVLGHPVLGTTATGHSGVSPVVWIYWPSVVGALGLGVGFRRDFLAERGLGVALGRVVAHELVHALAPEVPHGHGLMAPGLLPDALRGPPLALDDRSAAAFNAAAQSWRRWGGPPPGVDGRTRAHLDAAAAADHAAAAR